MQRITLSFRAKIVQKHATVRLSVQDILKSRFVVALYRIGYANANIPPVHCAKHRLMLSLWLLAISAPNHGDSDKFNRPTTACVIVISHLRLVLLL